MLQTIFTWIQSNWELAMLAFLLVLGNVVSHPLGGLFYLLVAMTRKLPGVFGSFFEYILTGPVKMTLVLKLIAWAISSSGVLLGLGVHYLFWGTPNRPIEFWIILLVAVASLLNIAHEMLTFDILTFNETIDFMQDVPLNIMREQAQIVMRNPEFHDSLARRNFVDMILPKFIRLIFSFGVIYYSLGNLGVFTIVTSPPNLGQSLLLSLSLIDIVGSYTAPYTGTAWELTRMLSSFIIFFWLVIFISLAVDTIDVKSDSVKERASVDALTKSMTTNLNALSRKLLHNIILPGDIKITSAQVDPPGVDAGNEKITITNTTMVVKTLDNWFFEDGQSRRVRIPELSLQGQESVVISLPPHSIKLPNDGGVIRLFDHEGRQQHSVAYAAANLKENGMVFFDS